jgi:peptidoglycan hydrolase CwlO-like protein
MKRAATILVTLALFAAGAGAGAPASGQADDEGPKNPRTEREKVRRDKAKAAAQLDALRADADGIETALTDLADYVDYQETVLTAARQDQELAEERVAEAQADVATISDRIATLNGAVKQAALAAYTSAGSGGDLFSTMVAGNPDDSLQQDVMYSLATGSVVDALDELGAARTDLVVAQRRAEGAAERADEHRQSVEGKLADLEASIADQEDLSRRIDERIDETMAEAASLEALDSRLSKEIAEREAAIAAKVRAKVAAAKVPGAKVDEDGDVSVPVLPTPVNGLVRVNGITVDASIGPAIAQLVAWAAEGGIRLTGGGYRSSSDQIAVRRNNCGPSNYDIYIKPSSQCRPPAARPGKSMHEKGLAVDFACNGELISNYRHWCYDWIADHAPRVGLRNRGVEAWHWSTNGN